MSETLVMDPEADVELVVKDNARDRGEEDWRVLHTSIHDGRKFVTVKWESEEEVIGYLLRRDSMTEDDVYDLMEGFEFLPFELKETDAGNFSLYRDKGESYD